MNVMIFWTAFFIGVPLLVAWTKLWIWDWLKDRES